MAFPKTTLHLIPSIPIVFSLIFLSTIKLPVSSAVDVHALLPEYGLPKGLFPNVLNSVSISSDGTFTIQLEKPCYAELADQHVYYDQTIKGKLSYHSVSDVSGIQAKKLFLWLSVTGMSIVDSDPDFIVFHVGSLTKKLPANQFQTIPVCSNKACSSQSV